MNVISKGKSERGSWLNVQLNDEERLVADVISARMEAGLSENEECTRWAKHFFDHFVRKGYMVIADWDDWRQVCGCYS